MSSSAATEKKKVQQRQRQRQRQQLLRDEDYAAMADSFAAEKPAGVVQDNNDSDDDSKQETEEQDELNHKQEEEGNNNDDEYDNDDDDDDDDEEEDDDDEDVTDIFKGGIATGDDDDDDDEEEENEHNREEIDGNDEAEISKPSLKSKSKDLCTFDLRNLIAVNSHQIQSKSLYGKDSTKELNDQEDVITIPAGNPNILINEEYLLEQATSGCAQLIEALWQLPTEQSDAGPLAALPSYNEIKIPRALPPPPPKQETKWEKFAKAKGIPLNKEKRSQKVWDEATGTWMFRHGYKKANDQSKEWPIMEVKDNEDPYADPWERLRDAKRARKDKNIESRMRNEERVGNLAKGTTTRTLKSRALTIKRGKESGNSDRDNIGPSGVPVDMTKAAKRGKVNTVKALQATQVSTASLGKFDVMREGEPERRKVVSKLKKRKFESSTDKKVAATEGEKSMKILKTVMNGGVEREKARRKGALATGETAYDYDYEDGLGPSTFKKKKGRAGAGKMKKMTKKRVQ